ncbi:MAG: Translation initiation factor IF-2 [Candidatus Moranbacteria bacterium GW2011_GWF2_36_839]|nr:MAG: Translation initiation factor IF-2 [Candidatus Moranbacteria bacterium GW2011_GWF1_36_78]KKQ16705.1 MAG: Translation initiation factor IF-2 [Candidatus Moranbacteria bacterium GW2011_GWF2_36_839]HAT74218.1 translation initiation factor IF-2 [Candidatus Moranbacteria bacterium]HBY11414.1 translation initiation factor IF-2 [Candidatus Moranbacteria bacterium]
MSDITIKKISLPQSITVKKFSEVLNTPINLVITELMKNGILATINEKIDFETASIIASDLGFEVSEELIETGEGMTIEKLNEEMKKEKESGENLKSRPPIVTILGHVDHGKTTLLDTIRKANVAAKESGGITQHISAYQVKKKGQLITFVDTPGHEAFSAMRERGVSIADIAVLVVAADDGVRPQTKEVIEYLLAKKIPTVVAINKIDKPGINIQRVKQELADAGIVLEEWGGQVLSAKISAKQNIGIDDLLENILLIAEVEDFKANFKRDPLGIILESHLDPQKGPVATVLVKTGTLKEGQDVIAGASFGRIKRIEDFKGLRISEAVPGTPVSIIGLHSSPNSNDILQVAPEKSQSKSHSQGGLLQNSEGEAFNAQKMMRVIASEKIKRLNVILKSDVQGSLEALGQILGEIKSEEVAIDYIATGVGNITESDVRLAGTSGAIIYGFSVETTPVAKRMAETAGVEIKNYKIIYELVEDVKSKLVAMLPPIIERTDFGKMKVLALFKTGKGDMIIGGKITNGKMVNSSLIEVMRGEDVIGKGKLNNLQENKVNVDECVSGKECGITFLGNTKIKEGDILLSYKEEIKQRTL